MLQLGNPNKKENTMNKKVGCVILALVIPVLLVGGVIAALLWAPEVNDQYPSGASSAVVTVMTPLNGAVLPMNAFASVEAEALSATPIALLEFFVDGALVQSKAMPGVSELNLFGAIWTWRPAVEGEHLLMVRATDTLQHVTTSNVVRVTASKLANETIDVSYQAKAGDTLQAVAQKFGATPQEIVDANPDLNANAPLTAGQSLDVPVETPASPPIEGDTSGQSSATGAGNEPDLSGNEPTEDAPKSPPSKLCALIPWVCNPGGATGFNSAPAAPKLAAQVKGCDVKLVIGDKSNSEIGFFIYRDDAGSPNFKRIATIDAHNGASLFGYLDQQVFGTVAYYVSAFNKWGESPSKYVKVKIENPACMSPDWTGVGIQNGKLKVTEPVDKVYCYLSVNNGPWTRIPPNQHSFILPTNGEFDMSEYLKKLAPANAGDTVKLGLQCWGWKGNTLVYLGETETTLKKGNIQIDLSKIGQFSGIFTHIPLFVPAPPPPSDKIAPPFGLHNMKNLSDCKVYEVEGLMSPNICQSYIDSGKYQVLLWNQNKFGACDQYDCEIDGYKVYELSVTGTSRLLATIANPKVKMHALNRPAPIPGLFAGNQIVVVATKGDMESEFSNAVVQEWEAPPTEKMVTLPAKSTMWDGKAKHVSTWGCTATWGWGFETLPPGQIQVGFQRKYGDCTVGHASSSWIMRGAMWFDVGTIKDKILAAHLYLPWKGGRYDPTGDTASNQHVSCAGALLLGLEDYRTKDYSSPDVLPGGQPIRSLNITGDLEDDSLVIDVTDVVKEWKNNPSTNFGFTLMGTDENLPENGVDCYTNYGDMSIKVKTLTQ
jgi:LysM repeat protein